MQRDFSARVVDVGGRPIYFFLYLVEDDGSPVAELDVLPIEAILQR